MTIEAAAITWHAARRAFLDLPAGSPDVRARLNDLAEAEDALFKAVETRKKA